MEKAMRVKLEEGEQHVLHVASRIFSAYIISNQLTDENEDAVIKKSIDLAKKLTYSLDAAISAGSEMRDELVYDPDFKPLG